MRPTATLLLLLAATALATSPEPRPALDDTAPEPRVPQASTDAPPGNGTSGDSDEALDGEHEPVVRKKRTFGDVVFRGLADVLGYSVARKPPQAAPFPPPLAPVPGIDLPLQAGPPPAPPPPPPCGAPRAVAPPPCRAVKPPPRPRPPPPPPPCPKPRAVPRPKPKPRPPPPPSPPPPPPPPCAKPRANPATPAPCAPPPPPPPPPKDNLETITSNFRLDFNFNRNPAATPAPAAADAADDYVEQYDEQVPLEPVAIEPRAARLPQEPARKPRVFVDAFVLRNGVPERVDAVDAKRLNGRQPTADDDYLAYDDDDADDRLQYDDYEDAQESRDRGKAVKEFGTAVDRFWDTKKRNRPQAQRKLSADHYQNVHFGDRALAGLVQKSKRKKEKARPERLPIPLPEAEEGDAESTTTTEDPHRKLKPRVLPPTEHNPNNIDTVTVRVPPIYKEKRPKKYHRERDPDRDEEEEERETTEFDGSRNTSDESDTEVDDSHISQQTERPRKRRRKLNRRTRSTHERYSAGNYDYYGKKLPVSEEEKFYMELTIPPPTQDADRVRHEGSADNHFLNDHERIREDPERQADEESDSDDSERKEVEEANDSESERADESERSQVDNERTGDQGKADERERTDKLSPNAKVHLSGYSNKYLKSHNVQVDNPRPVVATVSKKTVKIGA